MDIVNLSQGNFYFLKSCEGKTKEKRFLELVSQGNEGEEAKGEERERWKERKAKKKKCAYIHYLSNSRPPPSQTPKTKKKKKKKKKKKNRLLIAILMHSTRILTTKPCYICLFLCFG